MQFCSEPGCHVLVARGHCAAHTRYTRATYTQAHRWSNTVRWHRLRAEVRMAEPFCRACLAEGRNVLMTDVDHIVPHDGDAGRFWDRNNLQSLCKSCHSRKTIGGA
jgi:5-methylcytosine-specific restriction protein A